MAAKKKAQTKVEVQEREPYELPLTKMVKRDVIRLGGLIGIMAYLHFSDPHGFSVIIYMITLMAVIALFSHLMRRVIFPYLDMGDIANRADESPLGAAIIFASICFIIGCLILAVSGMLS